MTGRRRRRTWHQVPDGDALLIQVFQSSEGTIFRLKGELDLATAPQLRHELAERSQPGVKEITLDLAELSFMDSVGLSILVAEHKKMRKLGGALIIQNLTTRVNRLIEVSGLTDFLNIQSDGNTTSSD
jgi:anti-sigma B factor antagonist